MSKSVFIRWGLVAIAVAGGLAVLIYALSERSAAWTDKIENLEYNDLTKVALDNKTSNSRAFFQSALVIGGLLWGLIVSKKGEVKIVLGDWPEGIMLLIANVLIAASLIEGFLYSEDVIAACRSAIPMTDASQVANARPSFSIPDVFGARFNYQYLLQVGFLLTGSVVAAMTFFSAHRLKELEVNEEE